MFTGYGGLGEVNVEIDFEFKKRKGDFLILTRMNYHLSLALVKLRFLFYEKWVIIK